MVHEQVLLFCVRNTFKILVLCKTLLIICPHLFIYSFICLFKSWLMFLTVNSLDFLLKIRVCLRECEVNSQALTLRKTVTMRRPGKRQKKPSSLKTSEKAIIFEKY